MNDNTKGYKAFKKGMVCAPDEEHVKQYEENTTYEEAGGSICNEGAIKIGSSGYSAKIGSSGNSAQIGSSGDYAKIGSSGNSAQITVDGTDSVAAAVGIDSVIKAKAGNWITLAEWVWSKEKERYIPVCVKSGFVDGETLKADMCYKLVNGEFTEVR